MYLGLMQNLKIERITPFGAYLVDLVDSSTALERSSSYILKARRFKPLEATEVLLPNIYLSSIRQDKEDSELIGQSVEVFIYTDSEDRPVATTIRPILLRGQIGVLMIKDKSPYGYFLDLGIAKDLFMPINTNDKGYKIGDKVPVFIDIDKQNRLIAFRNYKDHLLPFKREGKYLKLPAVALNHTELGLSCVVDGLYLGLIFNNCLNQKIKEFTRLNVYVTGVSKDYKLNLALEATKDHSKDDSAKILAVLEKHKKLNITSKSDAKEIENLFAMSKKRFKAALNALNLGGKIKINDGFISI